MTQRARALVFCLLALLAPAALIAPPALACLSGPPIGGGGTQGGGNSSAPGLTICLNGAPVNCASGNQTEEQTDLTLDGRGPALHITRSYNSQAAAEAK